MAASAAACDWGRAWSSRSRTQGAAFGGAKGKAEDAEMRSATSVIQACGVVKAAISTRIRFSSMPEAYVVDAIRTPMGSYRGALSGVRPDDLAAHTIRSVVER